MQENERTSGNAKPAALFDAWLHDYTAPQDLLGEHGRLKHRTKRVVARALAAELTTPLGSAPHGRQGPADGTARHGQGQKTGQTATGPLDWAGPRDRQGRVAPQGVPTRQCRLEGCDDKGVRR